MAATALLEIGQSNWCSEIMKGQWQKTDDCWSKKYLVSLKERMATCPLLRLHMARSVFAYKLITAKLITQRMNAARSPMKKNWASSK